MPRSATASNHRKLRISAKQNDDQSSSCSISGAGGSRRKACFFRGSRLTLFLVVAMAALQLMKFEEQSWWQALLVRRRRVSSSVDHYATNFNNFHQQQANTTIHTTDTKSSIHNHKHNNENQNHLSEIPIHVLFGLAGRDPGFFAEFEVALKSVLLNAPHHDPLEIHIMTDQKANNKLRGVWKRLFPNAATAAPVSIARNNSSSSTTSDNKINVIDTFQIWYNTVTITIYNVEPYIPQWKQQIQNTTSFGPSYLHSLGAYFRILCYHVLPQYVQRVFYLDTDVVIMANLAQVWNQAPKDDDWFFQMQRGCSGVMLINVPELPRFWAYVSKVNYTGRNLIHADQDLILGVQDRFDNVINDIGTRSPSNNSMPLIRILDQPWDLLVTRDYRFLTPEKLFEYRPQVGAVHYNGGGADNKAYFQDSPMIDHQEKRRGWGIAATFYVDLPWSWVFYMGQARSARATARSSTAADDGTITTSSSSSSTSRASTIKIVNQ